MSDIVIYTQPGCLPCKRVIGMLEKAEADFEIIDISEDQEAKEFLVEALEAKTTPVIHALTGFYYGYDECRDFALGLRLDTEHIHDYVYEGE